MFDMSVELPAKIGDLAQEVYSDGAKETLRETSKIGVDAAKTLRLALAPLQFTAMLQDRVAMYFKRAADKASPENRVSPAPSLALPILEKLRYQEDGDLLTDIYVELLSASFDKSRTGDAHPAFLTIISQLSPDEIRLISSLAGSEPKNYFGRVASEWTQSSEGIIGHLNSSVIEPVEIDWSLVVNPDEFMWPAHLQVYIGHLHSLGLIEYTNDLKYLSGRGLNHGKECWAVTLTEFGSLFHRACVKGAPLESFAVTHQDKI
ncbi:DUF4393 domain-containing protein [Pseudomonas sp. zfem001]|uniref:DUF4393 domain-containing protein n=1 Tax=Pseudomonas sp. zfem001 TaxID=3078196 RepID=UPI002929E0CC|nr:DUF4393 domain-containing protein [Pseudomonas sp. zfem001]MDU9406049.1 DUF4393 domain-containing protein [Pseudomonas sp. zfem001]